MERLILEFSIRTALAALGTTATLGLLGVRRAAARHAAWAGVVLFMLVLPVWTAWGPKAEMRVLPAPAMEPRASTAASAEASAAPMRDAAVNPSISSTISSTPPPRGFGWPLGDLVWGIYAVGSLWLLARLAIGTIRAKRLTGADCVAPVTVGLLRPRVILPQGWSEWTAGQLDAILAHECAHVRRRDPLVQWLALLNRAVFWFHPLAWWLERRLAALAEEACDDAVLERGHDAAAYAEYLLDMERSVKQAGARVPAQGMAMPGSGLPRRIRLIFDGPRWPRLSRTKMLCAVAACSATAAVFGAGTLERMPELRLPPIRAVEVQAPGLDAIPASTAAEPKGSRVLLAQAGTAPRNASQALAFPSVPAAPDWQTAAGGRMSFAVASIKRAPPSLATAPSFPLDTGDAFTPTGGRFIANFQLGVFIRFAYKINPAPDQKQAMFAGLPGWVSTDRFTIEAKAEGNPTKDQFRLMMQSLLADRFKLAVHFEAQEGPLMALALVKPGKLGPKLHPHDGACDAPAASPAAGAPPAGGADVFPSLCGAYGMQETPDHMHLQQGSRNTTMAILAVNLPNVSHGAVTVPVVDQTGLAGAYDFTLEFSPEPTDSYVSILGLQPDPSGPTFLDALREQLGLKLESTKGPIQTLVIDHVESPTEN
jgi:bla regulator protein blaR1